MPVESLILRRVFPVPVTFADLRRAHDAATPDIRAWYTMGACLAKYAAGIDIRAHWHAAIKEATGALPGGPHPPASPAAPLGIRPAKNQPLRPPPRYPERSD